MLTCRIERTTSGGISTMVTHDLVIRGGTVVDGTGAPARTADVAITDGMVTDVGRVEGRGNEELDADGALVTPGFVDIHTHYDGQATWDEQLTPSCWHGVTTVVMGNCGVGFAPVAADRHEWLIGLMEGVEDIPGAALSAAPGMSSTPSIKPISHSWRSGATGANPTPQLPMTTVVTPCQQLGVSCSSHVACPS